MAADFDSMFSELEELGGLFAQAQAKDFNTLKKDVAAISQRATKRSQAEAEAKATAEAYAYHPMEDDTGEGDGPSAEAMEKDLEEKAGMALEQLQEGSEPDQPEPASSLTVIYPTQVLSPPQLQHLPCLQPFLSTSEQVESQEQKSSTDAEAAAAAAFSWLLGQQEQLLVCPDEATAKAVFHAVWCCSSEVAAAAYRKFLVWCGLWECQAGSQMPELTMNILASSTIDSAALCGAASLADLQSAPSIQWLPAADDFVHALTAMGCNMPAPAASSSSYPATHTAAAASAAAAGSSAAGGLAYADGNLHLLLQLLAQLYKLGGAAGRLPVKLGQPAGVKQLALLLLALLLEPRVAGSAACRVALADAIAALVDMCSEVEWRRLEAQLLEQLTPPGLGPSSRSTVLLLSQLPLTARCVSLRQQGAVQLVAKLLGKKQQVAAAARSGRSTSHGDAERSIWMLLGKEPDKLLVPRISISGDANPASRKQQQRPSLDMWDVLDVVDAAHLVLWAAVVRAGGCTVLDPKLRQWFENWTKTLESMQGKSLKWIVLRRRLTELHAAYEWSGKLGFTPDTGSEHGSSKGVNEDDF